MPLGMAVEASHSSTFILIHGAWHGAWCWYKVIPRLVAAGHSVIAPDLPSLGIDQTPLADISLAGWTRHICDIVDAQPQPVVLVGHSRGGIVISSVAEQRPDKIGLLVYLSAYLLRDGQSLLQEAEEDSDGPFVPHFVPSGDGVSAALPAGSVREMFYNRCGDDDVALAQHLLRPEPLAPASTPMHVTEARFGRVPRVYIETLQDNAIPLSRQRKMQARLPCRAVVSLDTGHSSFFSVPDQLVGALLEVSAAARK